MGTAFKNSKFILLAGALVLSTYYFISTMTNQWSNSARDNVIPHPTLVKDSDLAKKNGTSIYLLFFNSFQGIDSTWGLGKETSSPEDLMTVNCQYTNCIFTSKSDLLPNVHDFDVVFVTAWWQEVLELPKTRHPRQVYVFSMNEAAARINHDLKKESEVFNMTMTVRLDSDIPWPYGEITDAETGKIVAPALKVDWKSPDQNFKDEKVLEIVKNKTKFAAWFVTSPSVPSRRLELTEKLQRHGVEVDIYGKYGNLTMPRNSSVVNEILERDYKFYLSFENSLCVDYVTEKLFKVMNSYTIPVVYSGADLNRFAPPNSYIDANSFPTAEKLAEYLKFLDKHPEEYVKFFWWKKYYKVRTIEQFDFDRVHMCKICEKFNDPYLKYKTQVYSDIHSWFHENITKQPIINFLT